MKCVSTFDLDEQLFHFLDVYFFGFIKEPSADDKATVKSGILFYQHDIGNSQPTSVY
jgi:hypothetical protein